MPIPSDIENMISEFEKRSDDGAYPNLLRKRIAKQLRDRIETPTLIDQQRSSLCGPAAFLFCVLKQKPKDYVKYIIDLYENGEAAIGRLHVKPSPKCMNYNPSAKKNTDYKIQEADWISLAGLRDSENIRHDRSGYNSPGQQMAGITLPNEIAHWFAMADFKAVREKAFPWWDSSFYTLLQAHKQYISGACVCLFIGGRIMQSIPGGKWPADHWVVMASPIVIDGKSADSLLAQGKKVNRNKELLSQTINFKVYTWGHKDNPNFPQGYHPLNDVYPNLTVEKFLDYFYGYVSAQ